MRMKKIVCVKYVCMLIFPNKTMKLKINNQVILRKKNRMEKKMKKNRKKLISHKFITKKLYKKLRLDHLQVNQY